MNRNTAESSATKKITKTKKSGDRSHNTQDQELAIDEVGPHPAGKRKHKVITLSSGYNTV